MRVWVAALLALLATAAPAYGAGTVSRQGLSPLVGGPVFAGQRVMWAVDAPGYGHGVDVHSSEADGSLGAPWNLPAQTGANGFDTYLALGASADRMAVSLNVYGCYPACKYQNYLTLSLGTWSAATGETPVELERDCTYGAPAPSVDVSGHVVAYRDPCALRVIVRDYAAGRSAVFQGAGMPRVAGEYLATFDVGDQAVVLRRWSDGAELLRFPAGTTYDVQPDGKLAWVGKHEGRTGVLWASPESPAPSFVAADVEPQRIRIGADRVAFGGRRGAEVRSLDGGLVATAPNAPVGDFDGSRLVWAARPCAVVAILTWDLQGEPPALPGGTCPVAALRSATLRARAPDPLQREYVPVKLTCPPEPSLGCEGNAVLYGRDLRKKPNRFYHPDGSVDLAAGSYRLGPGENGTIELDYLKRRICIGLESNLRPVLRIYGPGGSYGRPPPRSKARRVRVKGLDAAIRRCAR
jgi:hypothetical protein